jgi:hypothetical protein
MGLVENGQAPTYLRESIWCPTGDSTSLVPRCATLSAEPQPQDFGEDIDTAPLSAEARALLAEAMCIEGHYPLFNTEAESSSVSPVNTSHTHTFDNVTYYMPEGYAGNKHGDYTCSERRDEPVASGSASDGAPVASGSASAASGAAPAASDSDSSLSAGKIAGIVVGAFIGAVLVAYIIYLFLVSVGVVKPEVSSG